ncbi:MAG: oxygenase MpaB family protein, partial [Acidimicrobiales bacterium]
YASTPVAETMIGIVRAVHRRVVGSAPDGRPYDASDPELLRWIHVAEVHSFLRAHTRYHPSPIRGRDIDRYLAENVVVAERLGATEVPASAAEVEAYLEAVRPQLVGGGQAHEAMEFLCSPWGPDPLTRVVSAVISQAALDTLPGWAREMHGVARPPMGDIVRPTTWALLSAARALIGPSPIKAQATERCRQGDVDRGLGRRAA